MTVLIFYFLHNNNYEYGFTAELKSWLNKVNKWSFNIKNRHAVFDLQS